MAITLSIIIPCYNAGDTIVETVQSALDQRNVAGVEVIVVDDGSTDRSRQVLEEANVFSRIRYARQDNRGVSAARNTGLAIARGRFICFLDSDDVLEPSFGQEMIEFMRQRNCQVGYCNYRYFADTRARATLPIRYPTHEGNVKGRIISEHFIPTPGAVLIERTALATLRFDPRRSGAADWWFWIQLCLREPICFNPATLIHIRVRPQSMGRQKAKMAADVAAVLADAEALVASDPHISNSERARFLYRRASALLELGQSRQALGCWMRAARSGLGGKHHVNFLVKFALAAVGAQRLVERALWNRRTGRQVIG